MSDQLNAVHKGHWLSCAMESAMVQLALCAGTNSGLSYCGSNIINHFGCEYSAIHSVSSSDPFFSQMACFIISTFNEACRLLIIMASYVFIVATVNRMPSKGGLHKAFSTCTSHLTAISIFHGIILLLYCMPHSKSSWLLVKVETVLFTVMIPMLNPLIYSLRNKDVKETVRKQIHSKVHSLHIKFR
ncbi:Olfactory receptor 5D16 [Sciurus carolinensis]|uniref:Olfactory receptor 5D16 n=1 Tax=Sciurus carolinensis TaxID=30640 RepID=A0AA41MJ35_SCICA|nr:Olfactory receptor 5D16 [Sciurus carolinensis]